MTSIVETNREQRARATRAIHASLGPFARPIPGKSLIQIATTIGLFLAGCAAMYWTVDQSPALTALLALPTAALLVRVFIVQHDCGHGSFFRSQRANDLLGMACSVLTLAPYANWRRQHAGHHETWNNLDKRESGTDIYSACLTVAEYRALPRRGRIVYRLTRHPVVAHLILPTLVFVILYRVPFDTPKSWTRERWSVYATDAAIVALFSILGLLFGFWQMALIQLSIIMIASTIGVWLFALQHRFETARWDRQPDWDYLTASLKGTSFLRLPRILQWFTGSIGFHHIHHLNPFIPNYRLEECSDNVPALGAVRSVTLWSGLKSVRLALWDEDRQRLVTFADASAARTGSSS